MALMKITRNSPVYPRGYDIIAVSVLAWYRCGALRILKGTQGENLTEALTAACRRKQQWHGDKGIVMMMMMMDYDQILSKDAIRGRDRRS